MSKNNEFVKINNIEKYSEKVGIDNSYFKLYLDRDLTDELESISFCVLDGYGFMKFSQVHKITSVLVNGYISYIHYVSFYNPHEVFNNYHGYMMSMRSYINPKDIKEGIKLKLIKLNLFKEERLKEC